METPRQPTVRVNGVDDTLRARLMNLPLTLLPPGQGDAADLTVGTTLVPDRERGKVLDLGGGHAHEEGWTLGFPELAPDQPDRIARASRVSIPGAPVLGALALIKPLTAGKLLSAPGCLSCSVTGADPTANAEEAVRAHSGLAEMPRFTHSAGPAGSARVEFTIGRNRLSSLATVETVRDALTAYYANVRLVEVAEAAGEGAGARDPDVILLSVTPEEGGGVSLSAALDENRTGAVVRVVTLMLGLETADESPDIEAQDDY